MQPHDTTLLKTCTGCGRTQPVTCFSRDRRASDGLQSKCKDCNRSYYLANKEHANQRKKILRQENPEAARQRARSYRESHRESTADRQRAWYVANRDRLLARAAAYRTANREAIAASARAYHQANPLNARLQKTRRRARNLAADGSHTAADVQAQHARQNGRCYWCGKKLDDAYHVDHIVPLSRGGTNWPDNLVIACPFCNHSKKDKLPHEWAEGGRLL